MKTQTIVELKRIASEHGGLLIPEIVVQKAKVKTSPLHRHFEWSDTKAAQQYRIWQARQLISITVELIGGVQGPAAPVFVSLTPDRQRNGGGYRIMTEVLSDAEMRKQMLSDALAELNVFQQKYVRLKELAEIFQAVRRVRRKAA